MENGSRSSAPVICSLAGMEEGERSNCKLACSPEGP